jgi:branched-chain amino acid transport system substrate-binding protein
MMSKTGIAAIIAVVLIASLSGGLYYGYNLGASDSQQQLIPVIDQLNTTVANITAENAALRQSLPSISHKTIKIGYIAPDTNPWTSTTTYVPYLTQAPVYTTAKPFIEKDILPNINAYARDLGVDTRFEFVIMDAEGQSNTHLSLIQELKQSGIDIFIGSGWSSQACSSMSYVNVNKMLMVSPSSTSPSCAVANDRFFRMCPIDGYIGSALADIIWSYGIEEIVIIQRGDSYADGLINVFAPKYAMHGGFSQSIRYPLETQMSDYDFCPYLQEGRDRAQEAIARMGGDSGRVGVLLIAYDEAARVIQQAAQCDVLYNLTWFGSDSVAKSANITVNAPMEANHLKLFSLLPDEPDSQKYIEIKERCMNATGGTFNVYYAYLYDSAFALARAIIETGSDNASKITAALPGICESTIGASGWLKLNRFGDRAPPPFTIWYYAPGAETPSDSYVAGTYRNDTNQKIWNTRSSDYVVRGPKDSDTVELAEPRIVSDKQEYRVGEAVRYRLEFHNPNQVPLTFQPPPIIDFLVGYIGDEPGLATFQLPSNTSAVIIPPGGTFYPVEWMCEFTVGRTGYYKITYDQFVLLVVVK